MFVILSLAYDAVSEHTAPHLLLGEGRIRPHNIMAAIGDDYYPTIQRLPAEILVVVFTAATRADNGISKDLLAITHVCQRWRAVATTCPSLWTEISLDRPHLARLFLDRSSNLPLTINSRVVPLQTVAELLNVHTHRLLSMHLHPQIPNGGGIIQFGSAPILTQLTMIGPARVDLSALFSSAPPALTSLTLDRIGFNTPASLLSGLQHLTLVWHTLDLRSVLDILRNNPDLETFTLNVPSMHFLDDRHPADAPTVPLRRLAALRLNGAELRKAWTPQ